MHEQRLGRVAHARPLDLRVQHDRARLLEVGAGVDVDVAVARRGVDHRHRGDRLQRRLQALSPARDDQVDGARLGGELGQLLAAAARHQAHAALGEPGADGGRRTRSAPARRWSGRPSRSRAARSRCPTSGTARRRRRSRWGAPRRRPRPRRAARAPCARRGRSAAAARRSPRPPGRAARRSASTASAMPRCGPRPGAGGPAARRRCLPRAPACMSRSLARRISRGALAQRRRRSPPAPRP